MNKRLLLFQCVLALLLVCSSALLSAHTEKHVRPGSASCILCISHGNASNALTPTAPTLFLITAPPVRMQDPGSGRLAAVKPYRTPARAPPPAS